MSLKILEEDIKLKKLKGVYLFYGDDIYDIERYTEKIKKTFSSLELGVNLFYLDKSNISELADICDCVSFFGEEKLVIVKDTKLKFNVDILENVQNSDVVVIIIEPSVDKRTSEFKKMQKLALCVEFAELNDKDAAYFVKKTLAAYKINVQDSVANYMVEVCTADKQLLINEFKKIVAYLKPGENLTEEIIDRICVRTLDAKIFDVIDNIVAKKKDRAFKDLDDLIAQKTYIGLVASMLFKQLKQLYQIKLLEQEIKKSGINKNIAQELGINPFVLSKLNKIKEIYTIEKIEQLLIEFAEYDLNSKQGMDDMELGLKRIISIM